MCIIFAFASNAKRFTFDCVLLLLVFLPTMSGISKPATFEISGIVMTWTAAFVVNSSSRQKMDLAISKNNVSVRLGLSLEKRWLWSSVLQCENWKNWSILTLLITNYSSVYSIYLFYLSIYLSMYTFTKTIPCLAEDYFQY